MIGLSVYLGTKPFEEHEKRIRTLHAAGFRSIFTSLHIPENDASVYKKEVQLLGSLASELRMELMVDVSPSALETLGLTWDRAHELTEWGISGLRLDYGIHPKIVADLSHAMKVALNASTITSEELAAMKSLGLRAEAAEAWHNFYPRPETGLGKKEFTQRNRWLQDEGLNVMAFAPGDGELRGPLFETLPTLEKHRGSSSFASSLELLEETHVDKVLIGDPGVNESSLAQFTDYAEGVIPLRAAAEPLADQASLGQAEGIHTNRPDSARDVVRSTESRHAAMRSNRFVAPKQCTVRPTGTITVDNERYLRYQGELQVTKTDLPANEKVNVLGRVIEEDRALLAFIRGNKPFKVVWI